MKLQETPQGQPFLSIPRAIAKAKRWKKGDNISIWIDNFGKVVLEK